MAVQRGARHEDYTLAVGEELTRAKAQAVLARYADEVLDAAEGLTQQLLDEDPRRDVVTSVCSVKQLLHHCARRGPNDEATCLGVVYFLTSGGHHKTFGINVRWDTEEVRITE